MAACTTARMTGLQAPRAIKALPFRPVLVAPRPLSVAARAQSSQEQQEQLSSAALLAAAVTPFLLTPEAQVRRGWRFGSPAVLIAAPWRRLAPRAGPAVGVWVWLPGGRWPPRGSRQGGLWRLGSNTGPLAAELEGLRAYSGNAALRGIANLPAPAAHLADTHPTPTPPSLQAAGGEFGLLEGRTAALVHPAMMFFLFGASAYAGYLGLQWRRTRDLAGEIKALKEQLPAPDADGKRPASPLDSQIAALEQVGWEAGRWESVCGPGVGGWVDGGHRQPAAGRGALPF